MSGCVAGETRSKSFVGLIPSLLYITLPVKYLAFATSSSRRPGAKVDGLMRKELKLPLVAGILSLWWRFTTAVIGTSRGGRVARGYCIT